MKLLLIPAAILLLATAACTGEVSTPSPVSFEVEDALHTPAQTVRSVSCEAGVLVPATVVEQESSYTGSNGFQSQGVINYEGWRCTYYNPVVMGTSHAILGNYTLGTPITDRGDGIGVVTGLVAVALPATYPYGTLIDTPFGQGICVDHSQGCMDVVVFW